MGILTMPCRTWLPIEDATKRDEAERLFNKAGL